MVLAGLIAALSGARSAGCVTAGLCSRSNGASGEARRWLAPCFASFFQAEDGIRDVAVTGVQTCALPISALLDAGFGRIAHGAQTVAQRSRRSEERRVGKGVDLGGRRIIKKKKDKKDRAGLERLRDASGSSGEGARLCEA